MKKLICLLAALMLIFTACGNRAENNTTPDGTVENGNGVVDENNHDNAGGVVNDAANGADDLVNGAADATKDAIDGVENAVDDVTGNGNNNARNR